MNFRAGTICVAAAMMATALGGPARAADARKMFCIAVRTVPNLDQDNYVMGATGPIYMTPTFATDLPEDEVRSMWASFVTVRHPVGYPSNPDDTCYPAASRHDVIAGQKGDIRRVSIVWTPALAARR
jgi:hypothetical protein